MSDLGNLAATALAARTGAFVPPFPAGTQFTTDRVDQGQDLNAPPGTPVLAAASGTVHYGHDPSGFGDNYPILILDSPINGQTGVYYGHIGPSVPEGTHVTAGQQLGQTLQTPGGNATVPGWLEIGWWGANGPTGDGASMASMVKGGTPAPAGTATAGADSTTQGGLTTPAATPPPPPFDPKNPPNLTADEQQSVAVNYPDMAWAITDPELGPILDYAAHYHMGAAWVQAQVVNTQWWKTHSDTVRQWQALQQTNPAEALQEMHNTAAQIMQQAGNIGLTIGQDRANQLAQSSHQFAWTPEQLQQALYAEYQKSVGLSGAQQSKNEVQIAPTGTADTYAQQAIQDAQQYLVKLDPATAQQLGFKMATGQMDPAALTSMFVGQAKARFAGNAPLMKALDSGITPAQILQPYQQTIGNILEVSPDQVNFTDPKFSQVLSARQSDGSFSLMSENEAAIWARSQPEWQNTQNYRDTSTQAAQSILTSLGAVKM